MVGWQHRHNGHELGQTLGDSEGQRGLACCSPWGFEEFDTTRRLNNYKMVIEIKHLCGYLLATCIYIYIYIYIYTLRQNVYLSPLPMFLIRLLDFVTFWFFLYSRYEPLDLQVGHAAACPVSVTLNTDCRPP